MTTLTSARDGTSRWRLPTVRKLARGIRSRRGRPPIANTTIRAVLERYGIGPAAAPSVLPMGQRSDNAVVSTSAGTLVVKRYPSRATSGIIRHEHSIARYLGARGFPVAPLRTTREAATWCIVEDRHFAVSDLVEGVSLGGYHLPPATEARVYRAAGQLLARFHDELTGFEPDGQHHLGLQRSSPRPGPMADGCLASLEHLREEVDHVRAVNATERWLVARNETIGACIRELDERLAHRQLAIGVIHGDYGLHNLTFDRDGTPTVHDLELARLDPLLIDLVVVLSRTGRRSGRAFLAGYHETRPIGRADWEALPDLWQHYRLCGAVRSWRNFRDQGGGQRLVAARRRVEEAAQVAVRGVGAWE
jgi:Ser/Thr protein kinase RdoA (MazF antagonist)